MALHRAMGFTWDEIDTLLEPYGPLASMVGYVSDEVSQTHTALACETLIFFNIPTVPPVVIHAASLLLSADEEGHISLFARLGRHHAFTRVVACA